MERQVTSWEAAGTPGRAGEVLPLCTESPEKWASHLRRKRLPEGGVIRDEVDRGVSRASESRGYAPARGNMTWSQIEINSIWLKL